ncbi:hypothetical protein [Pseudonocardia sp. ICBG1293]|uniref:hypothetical protein n=1 Tax=Pseudonocardia sp. ICBG1293 TaxID=2844382 RepID=UPI001CCEFC34|nr:hypothetical protein [Pseudonocardia sp. ICBG1293]
MRVSGLAAVVAWTALAGGIAAGVLLVLAHRRLERLEREHTARKWDIVALRAELRALHRHPDGPADPRSGPAVSDLDVTAPEPVAPEPVVPALSDPAPTGPVGGGTAPTPGTADRARTAGATAWRRAHRRPTGRTRRRPS